MADRKAFDIFGKEITFSKTVNADPPRSETALSYTGPFSLAWKTKWNCTGV